MQLSKMRKELGMAISLTVTFLGTMIELRRIIGPPCFRIGIREATKSHLMMQGA